MSGILVVGGAGYVGSHCCKALAAAGYEPIVYDNLSTGHASFVRWGRLIEGDVRDATRLCQAVQESKPDAVMHFAALALVGPSIANPGAYYDVNVVGTLRLLEAMLEAGVSALVFSSTCAVYGEVTSTSLTEGMPCHPINPYGTSKHICERMMDDFGAAHGLRSVRLRYFNAAGADPDAEIGERHDPETHLIPLVIETALRQRGRVTVFGTDYPTRDGTAVRDYIHVSDLAVAHLAALDHLLRGGATEAINLGSGSGASVYEVTKTVEAVSGLAVQRKLALRREGDPARLVANPQKACTVLGWQAKRDLTEIIADAFEWHRRQNG